MMVARALRILRLEKLAPALLLMLMPLQASAQTRHPATASLLVFKDEVLISQGSAVAIATSGHFLTAAHLLQAGNRLQLRTADGTVLAATSLGEDPAADLALLRVNGWRGGVAALALDPPASRAPVSIAGYWSNGLEPDRPRSLFGPRLPRFQPALAAPPHSVTGVVVAGDGQGFTFVADLGRGAYGAAILNGCGELQGLARAANGTDFDRLWRPHLLQGTSQAVGAQALVAWLRSRGVTPSIASQSCAKTGATPATVAGSTSTGPPDEQARRRQAEEKAALETRRRQAAERTAAAEKAEREKAEREAAVSREAQEAATGRANSLSQQVQDQKTELEGQERLLSSRTMALIGAGAALVLCLLLALLLHRGRRRALKTAAAAAASFPDCRFVGTGTDGTPLAATVPGKALRQAPAGLLIGRNPAQAQIVVADQSVSRVHARLRLNGNTPMISDAGSAGGTVVDGTPLAASEEMALTDGALVMLGTARLRFAIAEGAA